jgi:hypothetical protein
VSFLFRNAYFFQYVQNGFTFNFKLSGQIIDSNFHPFSNFLQVFPLRDHIDLTALIGFYKLLSTILHYSLPAPHFYPAIPVRPSAPRLLVPARPWRLLLRLARPHS